MNIPIRLVRATTVRELAAEADAGQAAALNADNWHDLYVREATQADAAFDRVTVLEGELEDAHEQLRDALTAVDNERSDAKTVREDLARLLEQLHEAREDLAVAHDVAANISRTLSHYASQPDRAINEVATILTRSAPALGLTGPHVPALAAARDTASRAMGELERERDQAHEQLREALAGRDQEREELTLLREAAGREGLILLLEWGRLHSVHHSVEEAQACAEKHGATPSGWGKAWNAPDLDRLPASKVWWRWTRYGYVSKPDAPADTTLAGRREP
ncbi:hypothetical protein E1265_35280 [Streptomyces sp. 8K308]|uniref:hypothetical protein n=1 Tax=Streptomyces sp. 8K308 TaxID=2530388 RepID=UPI001043C35A|nr:hypothetical protein [Streptomyces sp. 8K308]TDC05689.1 hypothetical protein E1265_35280 [Streptomyces sp. 8K308]